MSASILAFMFYLFTAVVLLGVFMFTYEKFTPYREFAEIKAGNVAAAIAFAGAILGFTLPIVSAIFFTHSIFEMVLWGAITGGVQLAVFAVMQRVFAVADCVKNNNVATAILLASLSITVGLISAFSISV